VAKWGPPPGPVHGREQHLEQGLINTAQGVLNPMPSVGAFSEDVALSSGMEGGMHAALDHLEQVVASLG
jgi:hypothetical protein